MKRVIVIIVLILVLLAGIGTYLIMSNLVPKVLQPYLAYFPGTPKSPDAPDAPDAPVEEEPPSHESKALLQMDTLTVPLLRGGKLRGQIAFDLRLEVELSNSERVREEMVRLRDAYLKNLYDFLPNHMVGRRTADLELVRERLLDVSDKRLGKGVVLRILFDNVFTQ